MSHHGGGMMRTRVMESRAYDSHYDPVFTYSGDRPRVGGIPAWSNSVTVPQPSATRANYRSAPRTSINAQFRQTQLAQTIPAIMPDGTIGRISAPVTSTNGASLTSAQVRAQLANDVAGKSRVMFFKRPILPFLQAGESEEDVGAMMAAAAAGQQVNMHGYDAASSAAIAASLPSHTSAQPIEASRTYGTQTDYRESETQTDPYTPDYITSPDEPEPEILGLAHLTYGAGLPISQSELVFIQRLREKKEFEASLPPITDAASFEKRKKMLEERELREWAIREEEMKEEQEDRLEILIETLKKREEKVSELNEQRLDLIKQEKLQQRDDIFSEIHRTRIKSNRALGKIRQNLDASISHMSGGYTELTSSSTNTVMNRHTNKRDIITEYSTHSSQVYAPIQREGKLPVKNRIIEYGIPIIQNYQGLVELERNLPKELLNNNTSTSANNPSQIQVKSLSTRKGIAIRKDLEYVDGLLEAQRNENVAASGAAAGGVAAGSVAAAKKKKGHHFENVYKKFEPVQRAPTPSVSIPPNEDATLAILLLQRLLRGRMVQNAMFEGKQHHQALIKELRVEEQEVEDDDDDEEIATDASETSSTTTSHALQQTHYALDTLQGELLSSTLDFLSKEVTRQQDERVLDEIVHEATLKRRHREAEESGRRQAEVVLREKRERQMKELTDLHSTSAMRWLDEVMTKAVEEHAEEEAERIVKEEADAVSSASSDPSLTTETLLGDLISSYLLPEVERRRIVRKEEMEERRFIQQAHQGVWETMQRVIQPKKGEEEKKEEI